MDVIASLRSLGFDEVIVLDGAALDRRLGSGVNAPTLLLALMRYVPAPVPRAPVAHIHPYYYVSQRAYRGASELVRQAQAEGIGLMLRDEIRVKPIFALLPGFSQGRNTLSFHGAYGSRFHVQILTLDETLPPTHQLEEAPHPRHCGECTLCMQACPTHAIDEEGFHRERCLRNWQLSGKEIPEALRPLMGSRFIGCDECQRCCPHNPPLPEGHTPQEDPSLAGILQDPKGASQSLKEAIGANLAIPNRVLAQALVCAGAEGDPSLLQTVRGLTAHPSPVVAAHAQWAAAELEKRAGND